MVPKLSPITDEQTIAAIAEAVRAKSSPAGEWIRWLTGLALAGLIAYFTTVSTISKDQAVTKEKQQNFQEEMLRRLDLMQADIRELRNRTRP